MSPLGDEDTTKLNRSRGDFTPEKKVPYDNYKGGGRARRQTGGPAGMPQQQGMQQGQQLPALPPDIERALQDRMLQMQMQEQAGQQMTPYTGIQRPPPTATAMKKGGGVDKWIQGTGVDKPGHKGRLHRALHVPEDKPIPAAKLAKAADSSDPHMRRMAQFAKNVK
jgi:hypothetical protein